MCITRGVSPFITKAMCISHSVYREISVRLTRLCFISPYNVPYQLGQNSDGTRSYPVLVLFLLFLSLFECVRCSTGMVGAAPTGRVANTGVIFVRVSPLLVFSPLLLTIIEI
jgi:hypothetical protein